MSDPVTTTLIDLGVDPELAEQLTRQRRERVQRQLAWWPSRGTFQNPGAALRLAIEEDWPPPSRSEG